MTRTFRSLLIWVLVSAAAFVVQLTAISGTYSPDGWVPVGNDAFYHARRIIDASEDLSRFYQFDPDIHVPEGSLLVWPWGYDFGMAVLLKLGKEAGLADDPVEFLAYVPPFAVVLAIALAVWIGRLLDLSDAATSLLALCVALSPLTQVIHGIGSFDHHYAEYLFVLMVVATTLHWLGRPSIRSAVLAGAVLGVAPAMHNGLFVLQLLPLTALSLLWMKGGAPPARAAAAFGLALVLSTLLVLLPSLPFRQGYFDYYLLSWFHLYVASCTASVALALAATSAGWRGFFRLFVLVLVLAVPLIGAVLHAGAFVGKEAAALRDIVEAKSVWQFYQERGFLGVSRLYTMLVFAAPLVWIGCLLALVRARDPRAIVLCAYAVLTLPLLLAQFRFHYYGSLAMYLPPLLLVDRLAQGWARKAVIPALVVVLALAYYPPARYDLGQGRVLGGDIYYPLTRLALVPLAEACREDPGVVLARANDGHPIRFHTDCQVIANNFLLTDQQFNAVRRVNRLFDMSAAELLASGAGVDYILVRARGILILKTDGSVGVVPKDEAQLVGDRLTRELLWGDPAQVPAGYRLVAEVKLPGGAYQYARIWKIDRREMARSPGSVAPSQ